MESFETQTSFEADKDETQVIEFTYRKGEVKASLQKRELLNEHILKIYHLSIEDLPEKDSTRLRLTVTKHLQRLTRDTKLPDDIHPTLLVRDFIQAFSPFIERKVFYKVEVEDLSLIAGRLVYSPRNPFILLKDPLQPDLIRSQIKGSRITEAAFNRQFASLIVSLAVKRLDLDAKAALKEFEALLDSRSEELTDIAALKALIEASTQADPSCAGHYIDRILKTPLSNKGDEEASELEKSESPFQADQLSKTMCSNEASVLEHSNISASKISEFLDNKHPARSLGARKNLIFKKTNQSTTMANQNLSFQKQNKPLILSSGRKQSANLEDSQTKTTDQNNQLANSKARSSSVSSSAGSSDKDRKSKQNQLLSQIKVPPKVMAKHRVYQSSIGQPQANRLDQDKVTSIRSKLPDIVNHPDKSESEVINRFPIIKSISIDVTKLKKQQEANLENLEEDPLA